ncbi:DUF5791 family protein [Natrononativus amylolyticus]|uniref:DUF5791 family protein n=1 Tax=Natrononativus amylolyticus TaxID=2963434 RepID=UPI0020CE5EC1|nr:DUF5791 family protein [Natrononativus amylolyticus]
MFYEQRMAAPESPAALRREYDDELSRLVASRGLEEAAAATGIDADRLEALGDGDVPDLALEEAAEIQALGDGEPDPETIVEIACEHLLLGMSTAILDVDSLANAVEADLDAKEIQQKIERRAPMTFDEYVHLQYAIADEPR